MKLSNILGLNARTQLFSYRYNTQQGKKIADSKIQTDRVLSAAGIIHPQIIKKFRNPADVENFNWESLPDAFALKPSRGLGGEGIVVVKKRVSEESGSPRRSPSGHPRGVAASGHPRGATGFARWITTQKTVVTVDDLKLHTLDILEGAYSIGNVPDVALIQEFVGRHKAFRKYAYRGTPDIRIIVLNKVPVMAMLRLPTKESRGRANLHQGAIGVGVDIATGITTKAIWHDAQIVYKPGTKRKLRGIKIPFWNTILETAVKAQTASGLGYVGVDIVLHPDKGPQVLELNAQPGLQIQLANLIPLRKRLERIEDLEVRDAEHGVKIAKALFAGRFADRVRAEEGIKTVKAVEEIKILSADGKKTPVLAKIDTGAWGSSIDRSFARELGIYRKSKVLWYKKAVSALGEEQRPVINLIFWLAGRKIKTTATLSQRKDLTYKVIVGRSDLAGFLVSPEIK